MITTKIEDIFEIELTERERKLIHLIREVGHGEIKVIIQDNCPIRIEELKKSIKL
ncbi:hypothetical protein [Acetoanaerobium noterae]|uniref:hypothetical protein n=1 Tax=Acetoanaerobium noterae TaxID=745369 RepID=UPI003318A124